MIRCLLLVMLLAAQVRAAEELFPFESDATRERYRRFTQELRCPKCQNQNIADSNAPIAEDLRRELHRLLSEGRSDAEIIDFMVSRYGEYVLYKPPLDPRTWLLWGAPVLLLAIGAVVLYRLQSRVTRAREAQPIQPLDEAERRRLRELTGDDAP